MSGEQQDPLPISLVLHYAFCPRRAWLEIQGERVDSFQVEAGIAQHAGADDPSTSRRGETRAVDIKSNRLGVAGKSDVLVDDGEGVRIREYKSTPVRREATVTAPMRVQLALQRLCLEEMGRQVTATEVYFTNHKRTVDVDLDDADYEHAIACVDGVRALIANDYAPEPLEDTSRCDSCSHVGVCLPDERRLGPVKGIRPLDPAGRMVYLTTQGAYVRLSHGQMLVSQKGEELARVPLETVQAVRVQGNVTLSGGLLRELMERDIPIEWCTYSGKLSGWSMASSGPNALARNTQHIRSRQGDLGLASEFISVKIANQATQLRRADVETGVVSCLRELQGKCKEAKSNQELLGIEGRAADLYFAHWPELIKEGYRSSWKWHGRTGRPATDAINAMLNYAYALLVGDEVRAIVACGLDPHAGFLHSSGRNKPALALDLMEEMRAPIVDSVVQTLINCHMVSPDDFQKSFGTVRMKDSARRCLIEAYERRMTTEFEHPLFKYKMTWRRALEVQARQVLGVLEHSQPRYVGIHVR